MKMHPSLRMALEIVGITGEPGRNQIEGLRTLNNKAFRKRSLLFHPDKVGGNGLEMQMMNRIWKLLEVTEQRPREILDSLYVYGFDSTREFYNGIVPTEAELREVLALMGPATPEPEQEPEPEPVPTPEPEPKTRQPSPEPSETVPRKRAHQAKTTREADKKKIKEITGHRTRRERDGLRYRTIWLGLEHLGAIWEHPETLIERDPDGLRRYIESKGTKSKNAQKKDYPDLSKIL